MNEATRIVKKYPNRRLYDTYESRYITLNDVRKLIVDGRSVTVVENKTGRDITSSILMQVISELESGGSPPLSEELLTRVIRADSHGLAHLLSDYLDASLALALDVEPAVGNGGDAQRSARWESLRRELAQRRASGNGQPRDIGRPLGRGPAEPGLINKP